MIYVCVGIYHTHSHRSFEYFYSVNVVNHFSMLHDRHTLSCDSVAAADFVVHRTPHTPYTLHTHTLLLLHYTPLLCPPLICFDYLSIWHCAQWTFSQGRRPVTQLVVCRVSLSLSLSCNGSSPSPTPI